MRNRSSEASKLNACRKAVPLGEKALFMHRMGSYELENINPRLAREYFELCASFHDEISRLYKLADMDFDALMEEAYADMLRNVVSEAQCRIADCDVQEEAASRSASS